MRTVPLQQICDIQIGKTPSRSVPEYWGGELPWVTISDFAAGRIVTTTQERITRIGAAKSGSKRIPRGTLLLSFKLSLGKRALSGCDLFTNEAIAALHVLDHDVADRDYLYWALGSIDYDRLVARAAKGKTLNKAKLKILKIPLPPLDKQKRIAAILDAADAVRAKRREAIAQLDTLLQSTFLDMFGDPVTNPMGWEVRSLGDLAVKKPNNGVFRRNHEYSESLDSGLPVVWVVELFRGNRIDVSESRRLEATQTEIEKYGLLPGDLLFCRSSLKLDGIAYNNVFLGEPEEALFECHLIRVSPKTDVVNPIFLNLQLRSVPMRALLKSKSKTATMTTIDQQALSSVEVVVPPGSLQSRFAAAVESVEQQKARQCAHLAELDTLFTSLQARAFRGDL